MPDKTNRPGNARFPAPLNRILAIRLDNIGDVVMTGPALRALRRAYPEASITLMASPAGAQTVPLLPWIDDCIAWRASWQDISSGAPAEPEKERELADLLEARRFDAAFIFTSFSQSPHPPAYACYMARIPIRVGQSKEFGGRLLTHWVKPGPDEEYQVERNLHLLRAVGIPAAEGQLELAVRADDQHSANALLAACGIAAGQPFAALAPGASCAARRYDEARFAIAAQMLAARTGMPVVLLGSPRETGKFPALEALPGSGSSVFSLIGRTSVPEMAAVIRRSSLVIANNSGAMHIAAAFNRPMVILFSGTEVMGQFAPRTKDVRLLNRAVHCSPCRAFECPYQMECLEIAPDEVAAAAIELVEAAAAPAPFRHSRREVNVE